MMQVDGLTAWYEGKHSILSNISFEIQENCIVGLLGLNGAGKTTLINTISGVHLKYSHNRIIYNSNNIDFQNEGWKKARYTVFTEEQAFSYWTFNEYLKFIQKVYRKNVSKNYLEKIIEGFGFDKYTNYPIKDLSTGNKKKVFLITGFSLQLPLLILDEPLDGLDFLASEFLYKEILEYKKFGSILMSSHIAESIERTCDKVLVLRSGFMESHDLIKNQGIREALEVWLSDK